MNIPATAEMLAVAERVCWFCPPDQTLKQPYIFLAHVMTYGTIPDVVLVRNTLGFEAFRETLAHSPPGVFDKRSWAYWHLKCGQTSPPPLPERKFG